MSDQARHEEQLEHLTKQIESMERTSVLANERTYAAWIRTGLTSLAGALALDKLLQDSLPLFAIRSIACTLSLLSALFFILASWRYQHVASRLLSTRVSGVSPFLLNVMTFLLIMIAVIATISLVIGTR